RLYAAIVCVYRAADPQYLHSFPTRRSSDLDERTVVVKMRVSDGEVDEFRATLPVVIDRGTYKATQTYETGDGITYGGQYWIAQKDGPTGKPGEPGSDGWRLAVRKGRDASNTATEGGTGI